MKKARTFLSKLLPDPLVHWVSAVRRSHGLRQQVASLSEKLFWQEQTIAALIDRMGPAQDGKPEECWRKNELSAFSQHGEDGILQYIFSLIGETDRRLIEFGCGDGRECNSAFPLIF